MIKKAIHRIVRHLPGVRGLMPGQEAPADPSGALLSRLSELEQRLYRLELGWPPGHFYSPLPDLDEVRHHEAAIFETFPPQLPGIDLDEAKQLECLEALSRFYPEQPFQDEKTSAQRYHFQNPNFSYGEAITLHSMIRMLAPARIVEIGSGYSSCVILDTVDGFLAQKPLCTFVEPYPELLRSLLGPGDEDRVTICPQRIQDVPLSLFAELEAGDILFVDSSHVVKVGSDVNHILFEILPRLAPGVYVHFHDIGYPFEYPKHWVYEGRAWNEAYALRAFLQFNGAFRIAFFNAFLGHFHRDVLVAKMPLFARNPGTSLWLERVAS